MIANNNEDFIPFTGIEKVWKGRLDFFNKLVYTN